jgi:hypothetical protein
LIVQTPWLPLLNVRFTVAEACEAWKRVMELSVAGTALPSVTAVVTLNCTRFGTSGAVVSALTSASTVPTGNVEKSTTMS